MCLVLWPGGCCVAVVHEIPLSVGERFEGGVKPPFSLDNGICEKYCTAFLYAGRFSFIINKRVWLHSKKGSRR